ncbi:putative ferric reductase transmembrane component 3 [Stipitochalara longipes BDJ]|nr:putative ferric reductase transmembrane component 3 [Stipitochalara longipes BDJ]
MAPERLNDASGLVVAAQLLTRATTALSASSTSTIEPFSTALNGVDQRMNDIFRIMLWSSLGILAMLILIARMVQRWRAHMRHMTAMNLSEQQQRYWAINREKWWWKFKKYVLYAPLKNKRHNREIRLSSALNMGTIPGRFHTIILSAFILSNIGYMLALPYSREDRYSVAAALRGRSGVLAVINMIALVIFAGRNNPLIPLLQISFDTYNLMHRWVGRTVVLEVIVHTLCWAYVKYAATGWSGIWNMIEFDPFISWGSVGMIAMMLIAVTSLSPVRHAFYETFLNVHIMLAFIAIVGAWIHCEVAKLPQLPYLKVVLCLWMADRVARMARLAWYNYSLTGKGWTKATIQALPGDACRVTLHLPRKVNIKPGSHAYLRFSTLNIWESHPFSIAWVEHLSSNPALPFNKVDSDYSGKQLQLNAKDIVTDVSFVIHAQTGLTKRLFDKANSYRPGALTLTAAFEGPYGGDHSLDSYGHVVLFAGSSGITHQIPYVQHLIKGCNEKSIATRKIVLVWIVRDSEHLEWVRPWMNQVLEMQGRRECLIIKLFVTRPKNPREINSPSNTVQMFPGRPNVKLIMQNEVKEQVGAMCVTVCGPGGLADNVREAVRNVQEDGVVDFIEESFTW